MGMVVGWLVCLCDIVQSLCLFGLLVCPSFLCEVCNLGESRCGFAV